MITVLYYEEPKARICLQIEIEDDTIQKISFCDHPLNKIVEGDFALEIVRQFDEYFSGQSCEFDLAYFATGTPFQLMVWEQLLLVPYGTTVTYKEIAERIGKPESFRAVGSALNANPVPIILPCHRVLGSDGSLTGYVGGIQVKRYLLGLEHNMGVKR